MTDLSEVRAAAIAEALDHALPASIRGRLQIYAASGIGAAILLLIQYFQPRYYPWLTPGMAQTVAGLISIGGVLAIHEITHTQVFNRLKESLHAPAP